MGIDEWCCWYDTLKFVMYDVDIDVVKYDVDVIVVVESCNNAIEEMILMLIAMQQWW